MGQIKHRLLFVGLSISAYASPLLMTLSILTHYWLNSTEKTNTQPGLKQLTTTPIILSNNDNHINNKSNEDHNLYFSPLDYIEASYGLWKMCRISDTSMQQRCEYIKYFQNSDSETRVTDTLKKQIGVCIVPIFIAMFIMIVSVILHTYAYLRQKLHYLYLISGCLFIFAGLASLTALIVFIAAVNGAVDNKLTLNKSKEEEPPFDYNYGFSFFCAVFSFLMQEFNGICNIYWYIDYYRKYRYNSDNVNSAQMGNSKFPVMPKIIKLTDLEKPIEKKPEIRIITVNDPIQQTPEKAKRPSINRLHKINHLNYKTNYKKEKIMNEQSTKHLIAPETSRFQTESSLTSSSHKFSSSSTSNLTESSSSDLSEYQTKVNTKSNRQLDENELKFKFYKLDKEIIPPEIPILAQTTKQNNFKTSRTLSKSPPSNKVRIQTNKIEYKLRPIETRTCANRAQRIRFNRPLIQRNKSLNDTLAYKTSIYDMDNYLFYQDGQPSFFQMPDEYYNNLVDTHKSHMSRINLVNDNNNNININSRLLIQSPLTSKIHAMHNANKIYNKNPAQLVSHRKRVLKRTTSV